MATKTTAFEELQNRREERKTTFMEQKRQEEQQFFDIRDNAAAHIVTGAAEYVKYLDVQAAFYRMGTHNTLAITGQRPGASVLKTKAEWQQAGRNPRDYEPPVLIRLQDKDSGFYNVNQVYDISQTEGKFYPQRRIALDESTVKEANQNLLSVSRVPVTAVDNLELPAFFDPNENKILIRSNLTHTELFKYLPYEMALATIPREYYNREAYHIEAASAAYVIHKRFGAETLFTDFAKKHKQEDFSKVPDFSGVTHVYGNLKPEEIREALKFNHDTIFTACRRIENAIYPCPREQARRPFRASPEPAR